MLNFPSHFSPSFSQHFSNHETFFGPTALVLIRSKNNLVSLPEMGSRHPQMKEVAENEEFSTKTEANLRANLLFGRFI